MVNSVRVKPLSPIQGADERCTAIFPRSGSLAVFKDADGHEIGRSSYWELDKGDGFIMRVKGSVPARAVRGDFLFKAGAPFGWNNIAILKGA